jgi:hypothetical protein
VEPLLEREKEMPMQEGKRIIGVARLLDFSFEEYG